MGQANSTLTKGEEQEIQYYSTISGLSTDEVESLKSAFNSLKPNLEGRILVENMRKIYENSFDKHQIDQFLVEKRSLSFSEFFQIMSEDILEKKKIYKNIEFEAQQKPIHTCFYCPMNQNSSQV